MDIYRLGENAREPTVMSLGKTLGETSTCESRRTCAVLSTHKLTGYGPLFIWKYPFLALLPIYLVQVIDQAKVVFTLVLFGFSTGGVRSSMYRQPQ
ncbi:hypothetical protein DFH11DRAFT_223296 [Phellopilus nigrolimitatus]|nr:hypothetical protein DFH11DRAFT_223296 [Phellopilus nigrolimitatus]